MFGLGFSEILVIAVIALVFIGPDRLPQAMKVAGRLYGQLRRASDELRRAFVLEADRVDSERRLDELQERRRKAMEARRKAAEANGDVAVAQEPSIDRLAPPAPDLAPPAPDLAPPAPAQAAPPAPAPPEAPADPPRVEPEA